MADRQRLALMALNIVDGVGRNDADAEALITAAFVSQEEAAEAYAYLCGFILEALAHSGYDGSFEGAKGYIRRLINKSA
jgi:hypothetical protein